MVTVHAVDDRLGTPYCSHVALTTMAHSFMCCLCPGWCVAFAQGGVLPCPGWCVAFAQGGVLPCPGWCVAFAQGGVKVLCCLVQG